MDNEQDQQQAQALWDEVAAEREQPTAVTPPVVAEVKPEPVATPETVPAESAPVAPEEVKPDPLAEALARLEKLENRQRNVEGHIGGLTSQQKALQTQLETAKAASQSVGDAPTDAQMAKAITNPEAWEKLKGDFPEWAGATESLLDARLSGLQQPTVDMQAIDKKLDERLAAASAQARQEMIDGVLNVVLENWEDEVKTDQFSKWMAAQSESVQAMAGSSRVSDAARMLKLYAEAKATNPAQQILEERNKRLTNAASTPRGVRPPAVKTPDQMTAAELWDYEAKQREKSRVA